MRVARLAASALAILVLLSCNATFGQVAGRNINMVSGTQWPAGDPYLQRQNEPSMAVSTRNPQHLVGGANDYRTVDLPFPPDSSKETGDAWVGVFTSIDGGQTWRSTLLPGFPQDNSATGTASPLHAFAVATDPTVRAGTHGLFYYSGLVFARGNNAPSAVFVATFQDQNNKGNGNPISYLNASLIDTGTSGQFIDKPWIAVDIPRPGTAVGSASCNVGGKTITSGKAYVFYTVFNGSSKNPSSQIKVVTSANCGKTWTKPLKISQALKLNQGTVATIDPSTGIVYVFWRQLAAVNQPDSIQYAFSKDGGVTFTNGIAYTFPAGNTFDQSASGTTFRTEDLPAVAVDGSGRVWLAYSQRNKGALGTSRIMMTTLARGTATWTTPYVADSNASGPGHQFMPSLAFAYGKLMLTFYDNREDNTKGLLQCPANQTCTKTSDLVEVRTPIPGSDLAAGNSAKVFSSSISDAGMKIRHTIDVRGALIDPSKFVSGQNLPFPSFRISQYKYGSRPGSNVIEQMQFNPPNFPMFVQGTTPFIGDYIDVTALLMLPNPNGTWSFNTQPSNAAVFHTTWTDNRDVRPPPVTCSGTPPVCSQNWSLYTPVGSTGGTSIYDPTQKSPVCAVGQTGSRNQNVYTSRITQGLLVGLKENSKQLLNNSNAPIQRAFSVFVDNTTLQTAFYRITISPPPAGTTASFTQTGSTLTLDATVLPHTTISRTVFVTSSSLEPSITITVAQITGLGGSLITGGMQSNAVINPDPSNPQATNPDIVNIDNTNPDISSPYTTNPDIANAEVYDPTVTNPDITNPDITNPDITNPDITNPDITNPDITNPDITNYNVTNPDITNPDITNPDITNPDITNPDITNPDITNPDITNLGDNGGITDFSFKVTNRGNTSSSYNAKQFAKQLGLQCCTNPNSTSCSKCQLIARKTYPTPIANACTLTVEVQNLPVSSIPDPAFSSQTNTDTPDNSGDPTNSTVSLGPGEGQRVTLRVFGPVFGSGNSQNGLKTIAVAGGADTGQTNAAASLAIITVELPVAVVGTQYSGPLQSVGGVGATTWSETGMLPTQLTLNSSTGLISGNVTGSPSAYPLTAQVKDSATGTQSGQPNTDLQSLTLEVNKLSVTGVTAANSVTQSQYLKPGDSATVLLTVLNQGPATASNVQASPLTVNAMAAGTPSGPTPSVVCSAPTPSSATIASNSSQVFVFSCSQVSGNGFVSFTGNASAQYLNTAAIVNATAAAATSNSLTVDTTPPVLTVVSVTTPGPTPYHTGTWTNQSVTLVYACTDNLSGLQAQPVLAVSPAGPIPALSSTDVLHDMATATLTAETANGSVSAACTDNAGNVAAPPTPNPVAPIMIDTTPPTLPTVVAVAGTGNAAVPYTTGTWTNQNVTVTFTCKDDLSGPGAAYPLISGLPDGVTPVITQVDPLTSTAAATLTAETASTTLTASCTDNASNVASPSLSFGPIMIDKTPPTVTGSATTPAGPYTPGTWTNQTPVTVTFSCADALSGPVPSSVTGNTVFSGQTAPTTVQGSCMDVAGNTGFGSFGPVQIDLTAPSIVITTPAPQQTFLLNSQITPVFVCAEGTGGLDAVQCNATPSASPYAAAPVGPGTFSVSAVDDAGNASQASANYTVIYNFTGFQQPLAAAGTPAAPSNSGGFTVNSTIPIRWTLADGADTPAIITDTSTLASIVAIPNPACTGSVQGSGTTLYPIPQGSNSTFAYDSANSSFLFNWDTSGVDTGGCFNVVVTFNDTASYATIVNLEFVGFSSPLSPAGPPSAPSDSGSVANLAQNSMITVNWQLDDGGGNLITNDIFSPSSTSSVQAIANANCSGAPPQNSSVISLFGNGAALGTNTYSFNNGQYTLGWDVSSLPAGTCYNLVLTLPDGSSYATIVHN